MLSVMRVSVKQAKNYYSKDDYYLESAGVWQGKGADDLKLTGNKILEEDFNQLITGKSPKQSKIKFKIAHGGKLSKHTAGADLTFSAPKSVSCMALMFNDERIKEAHNLAVTKTLEYIEQNLAQVRLKVGKQVLHEKTDNIMAAKFMHQSSRELDPQLHTHCVLINASKKTNGEWRAMDYSQVFNNKMNLGMMYRNELAMQMQNLGYKIEFDSQGLFEIAGFNKEILNEFSARSKQIEERYQELKELYPSTPKAKLKAQATLETRKAKKEPKLEQLQEQWQERFTKLGISKDQIIDKDYQLKDKINLDITEAINVSLKALTETEAVISQEKIIATVNRLSFGQFSSNDIVNCLKNNEEFIEISPNKYTTKVLMQMEHSIVEKVISGHEKQDYIFEDIKKLKFAIAQYEYNKKFGLTSDQIKGVEHILHSKDKIIAIQGNAGTGKTTMLDTVRDICEKNTNIELIGLSYTGKASSEIQEASQIKSSTIASFLNSTQPINKKQQRIYIVDESSMISIKDMSALLEKCKSENAKIALIGDTKQLQSIGAGKIFTSLQEKQVISTVTLKENMRQKVEAYKASVELMASHKSQEAYLSLIASKKIIEHENLGERLNAIAEKYCSDHEDTILLTAKNKDRIQLNTLIREKLQTQAKIGETNYNVNIRESKNLQALDKFFIEKYKVNDIVVCHTRLLGIPNTEFAIKEIDILKHEIKGTDSKGIEHTINVAMHGDKLNTYKTEEKQFAQGEKIVFLRNDKKFGLTNGQTAVINKIEDNIITATLKKGKQISIDTQKYNDFVHAYAITTPKGQGMTGEKVIVHGDTKSYMNFNQAYVGMTRGQYDMTIFTDNKDKLAKLFNMEQIKTTTLNQMDKLHYINKLEERKNLTLIK